MTTKRFFIAHKHRLLSPYQHDDFPTCYNFLPSTSKIRFIADTTNRLSLAPPILPNVYKTIFPTPEVKPEAPIIPVKPKPVPLKDLARAQVDKVQSTMTNWIKELYEIASKTPVESDSKKSLFFSVLR